MQNNFRRSRINGCDITGIRIGYIMMRRLNVSALAPTSLNSTVYI